MKDQKVFYNNFKKIAPEFVEVKIKKEYINNYFKILKDNNHLVLNYIDSLEVGCGDGMLMCLMKNITNWKIEGIDLSDKYANVAIKKGLKVHIGSIENFKSKKKFDLIYGCAVLHHCEDFSLFFDSISRNLKNNGVFILGPEPNCYNFLYYIWHKIRGIWEMEKGQTKIKKRYLEKLLLKDFTNIKFIIMVICLCIRQQLLPRYGINYIWTNCHLSMTYICLQLKRMINFKLF